MLHSVPIKASALFFFVAMCGYCCVLRSAMTQVFIFQMLTIRNTTGHTYGTIRYDQRTGRKTLDPADSETACPAKVKERDIRQQ